MCVHSSTASRRLIKTTFGTIKRDVKKKVIAGGRLSHPLCSDWITIIMYRMKRSYEFTLVKGYDNGQVIIAGLNCQRPSEVHKCLRANLNAHSTFLHIFTLMTKTSRSWARWFPDPWRYDSLAQLAYKQCSRVCLAPSHLFHTISLDMAPKSLIGKQAPEFTVTNYDGEAYTFTPGASGRPTALFFYPKTGSSNVIVPLLSTSYLEYV